MKLRAVFQREGLPEFYESVEQWNREQQLNFGIDDPWEFTPTPELEGDGIDSAYIAEWAGEKGVLIGSSTGWDYYPVDGGMWTPIELFGEKGQKLLVNLGFEAAS